LRNWDSAHLLSQKDFMIHVALGEQQYEFLKQGLIREQTANPQFPKFYDTPEIFQLFENRPQLDESPHQYVARMKAWITDPAHAELIRTRSHFDLEERMSGKCPPGRLRQLLQDLQ
jgi:hypothetical protein